MKWVKASGEMVNMPWEAIQDEQLQRRLKMALAVTAFATTIAGFGVVKWSRRGKYEVNNPPQVIKGPERVEVGVEEILGDEPNVFLDITTKDGQDIEVPLEAFEYGINLCHNMVTRAQLLERDFATRRIDIEYVDAHIRYMQEALNTGVVEDAGSEVRKALDDLIAVRQLRSLMSEDDDFD